MQTPACPSTRALLLPIVRHEVAELLERVERLARGRGTEGHDLEHDSDEVWFATIPLHDSLQAFLSRPWDASDPPDAFDAAVWLRRVLEGTETVGAVAFPDGWEAHVERLSRPESRQALREILERLEPIRPAESLPGCPEAGPLRDPSGATPRAKEAMAATPSGEVDAAYLALIQELGKKRRAVQAKFLEYMQDRERAQFHDVATEVHGDDQTMDGAIRANVTRVNESLLAAKSSVRFTVGSGQVFKSRDAM